MCWPTMLDSRALSHAPVTAMVALPLRRGNARDERIVRRTRGATLVGGQVFPDPSGDVTLRVMASEQASVRVLVVDDNHLIRRLLTLILESAGYETVEAESAEDALALAAETPPDLWIVDEVMPGITGSELVRVLRSSRDPRVAQAPIMGLSGRVGASRDLLAAGCDTFVAKPIDEPRILAALRRASRLRAPAGRRAAIA